MKWAATGKCAYCKIAGKVDPKMTSKVAVDEAYLTTDLPAAERIRVIKGDEAALKRAGFAKINFDLFIKQIQELYFAKDLNVEQIADFRI